MGPIRELLAQRRQQQQKHKQQQGMGAAQGGSIHKRVRGAASAGRDAFVHSNAGLTAGLLGDGSAQAATAEAAAQAAGSNPGPAARPVRRVSGSVRAAAEEMLGAKPRAAAAQSSSAAAAKVPRPVQLRDFMAALEKVKPAMVDCQGNGT